MKECLRQALLQMSSVIGWFYGGLKGLGQKTLLVYWRRFPTQKGS